MSRSRRWRLRLVDSSSASEGVLNELQQSVGEHVQVGRRPPVHDAQDEEAPKLSRIATTPGFIWWDH